MLTPRQRVERSLRGGHSDRVPFTLYENKAVQCAAERELRNRGMCIVERNVAVLRCHRPNVKVHETVTFENGKRMIRTHIHTPVGELSSLREDQGFTSWVHEKFFKSPDDYKALAFYLQDERYEPAYEGFARAQEAFGEDAIFRCNFGLEPMQTLISGGLIDMQDWCEQWFENRDEILKLYELVVANRRRVYPIIAQAPVLHANYGGNVTPEIIGLPVFEKYYLPHYHEAAEVMHRHGKLIGCHFDANCRLLSKAIATTPLDYIEAFTPAPDTDMTLAEARAAWPDKVLWINFPSSVHVQNDQVVERTAVDLLNQLSSVDGVILGVTEDMPEHRWRDSCRAIMDGLDRHARENPGLYA